MNLRDLWPTLRAALHRVQGALGIRRPDDDLRRELDAHLALAEDELRRNGHTPGEAARLARATAGGRVQALEALRDRRALPWLDSSWLDVRLGCRLLLKNWGLTLIGGLATALAISIAAVIFTAANALLWSSLPLDEGDRVVALQVWDRESGRRLDTTGPDLERWRTSLQSVGDVGAFQTIQRNVITPDGAVELATVAQISAAGFRVARVSSHIGRAITEADSAPGAPPVVVIGHDVWQRRFGGSPTAIGRELRLGREVHLIVGVMPEGFQFPLNFRYWVPLRLPIDGALRNTGPEGVVFGRLAPGGTLERAHAEVAALGLLPPPTPQPGTGTVGARVVPYPFAFTGDFEPGELGFMGSLLCLALVLLLLPPCANIGILNYARIVTRQQEFAARHALGGSRGRIVFQLLIEALVLTAAAAAVALVIVHLVSVVVTGRLQNVPGGPPFWMTFGLSFRTLLFVAALALVGAVVSGLVPALQATGKLSQLGTGALAGRTSVRLGATWTTLVIAQVAFSVGLLPLASELAFGTLRTGIVGPGFAAEKFATARVSFETDHDGRPDANETRQALTGGNESERPERAERFGHRQRELAERLRADPAINDVAFALRPPGEEPWVLVDIEGLELPNESINGQSQGFRARFNLVDPGFFDLYPMPGLIGRTFLEADASTEASAVIVNRNFAETIAPGGNALGHRFRYVRAPGSAGRYGPQADRWYEVVGVVGNLPVTTEARVAYHAIAPGQIHPTYLQLGLRGEPTGLAERLRDVVARTDPTLHIDEVSTLAEIYREHRFGDNLGATVIIAVTGSVLLLSAAGLYALMAFTVAQRRREIGIRSALGAPPGRLVAAVFKRTALQIGAGSVLGLLAAYIVGRYIPIEKIGGLSIPGVLPGAAVFMLLVGALAALGPARRLLRIDPTEALRSD